MSLEIINTSNGKPHIIYNGYKYREGYARKNGEIVWRCLGKTCNSSVTTDGDRKEVIATKPLHSGHHPITLRSLTSPRVLSPVTPSASPATEKCSTTRPLSPSTLVATPLTSLNPANISETPVSPANNSLVQETSLPLESATSTPAVADIALENKKLMSAMTELNERYKCVLDHSIESDMRLMQYTEQVFVPNVSLVAPEKPSRELTTPVTDCAVQCQLPSAPCQHCVDTKDLIASLRTTIEVLEAEVLSLRGELLEVDKHQTSEQQDQDNENWTICKAKLPPIRISNYFDPLNNLKPNTPRKSTTIPNRTLHNNNSNNRNFNSKHYHKKINPKTSSRVAKTRTTLTSKTPKIKKNSINKIVIEGDSHARYLATVMKQRISADIEVSGVCKPGAKLLDVIAGGPPLPGSCSVIVAGTNNVAAGESQTVCKDLEEIITKRISSAGNVMVVTLPHRHDLHPQHPINNLTAEVNKSIYGLGSKLNFKVIDFNAIGRRMFTRHGMHLRLPGKRFLVDLILRSLFEEEQLTSAYLSKTTLDTSAASSSAVPAEPRILRHDSVAEALKQPPSVNGTTKDPLSVGRPSQSYEFNVNEQPALVENTSSPKLLKLEESPSGNAPPTTQQPVT